MQLKKLTVIIAAAAALLAASCGGSGSKIELIDPYAADTVRVGDNEVAVGYTPKKYKGAMHEEITVFFNGTPFNMLFDTGCTVTCITQSDYEAMKKEGTISTDDLVDFSGGKTASGELMITAEFRLKELVIKGENGKKIVVPDADICVAVNSEGSRLLGKNIIDQLGNYRKYEDPDIMVFAPKDPDLIK